MEDDEDVLEAITLILTTHGSAEVIPAKTIDEAKSKWREPVDAVLVDIMLPETSVDETCRYVAEVRAKCPIVVGMTAGPESWLQKVERAGAKATLKKPLDMDDLLNVLKVNGDGDRGN
ncbi:response regulator transcription factor [Candidatus Uhrbacteria bacterium]|nr:response regulator transcription factor [Candidatus Uhrbacteria bacterium]